MSTPSRNELIDEMHGYIRRDVDGGFMARKDIVESAIQCVAEEEGDEAKFRLEAEALTDAALLAHRLSQASWPVVTDCDRLDEAFAALEARGIVARQDFTCCGTCGSGEILDEMDEFAAAGNEVRGYAFFHAQDTHGAVEGGGLYLNYGSQVEGESAALAIAKEIVAELNAHGLAVSWDGSWSKRIGITLDWKRRR